MRSSSLKITLKRPRVESTDPADKDNYNQLQSLLEHKSEWTTVLPDLSLEMRNLTMSCAVDDVRVLGGERAPRNLKSCCSNADF